MRAVIVIGGFGLIPLALAALWVWLRPPAGRARFLPFSLSAAVGVGVAIASLVAIQSAQGMEELAYVIPLMMGIVTIVASLIALVVQAAVQRRSVAPPPPHA
jgi:hypothetical protein